MSRTSKIWQRIGVLAGLLTLSLSATAFDSDATIYIDRALNSPTLTVRYNGATAALAELRINGESYGTRVLNPGSTSGETTFSLGVTALNEGENQVEVRLFDKNGALVGTQDTTVIAEKAKAADIFLTSPKAGQTLHGPIEIKVGFGREFKNSFVSFFVDNQFKLMTNFPPYTYLWDTLRENNGWHDVEAWVVDDTSATFKTKKLRIFVDNPGGRTNRIFTKPAASAPVAPKPVALKPSVNPVSAVQPSAAVGLKTTEAVAPAVAAPASPATPAVYGAALTNPGKIGTPSGSMANIRLSSPEPVVATGPRDLTPTGTRIAEPAPTEAKTLATPAAPTTIEMKGAKLEPQPAALISPVSSPVAPKLTTSAPVAKPVSAATPTNESAKAAAIVAVSKTVTTLIKVEPGFRMPKAGSYAVVMDGKLVEFDIQPKVEDGVPMTPFRHLVEKRGGTVKWENDTKSVRANAEGRSILFQIGTKVATVDNSKVEMELAPYLDKNRTIVPLSFMRDSLHVNIEYDKATNHVLITSIKD